jgi:hypothetical protein
LLRGRIAKIISQTKVAINIGSNSGVKPGMKFVIYDEGDMINDPVTNQPIEKLEIIKGNFEITQVQAKTSIGESFRIETTYLPSVYDAFTTLSAIGSGLGKTERTKVEVPLTKEKIEEKVITPTPLKIGDLVRSVE